MKSRRRAFEERIVPRTIFRWIDLVLGRFLFSYLALVIFRGGARARARCRTFSGARRRVRSGEYRIPIRKESETVGTGESHGL